MGDVINSCLLLGFRNRALATKTHVQESFRVLAEEKDDPDAKVLFYFRCQGTFLLPMPRYFSTSGAVAL
jgi:hypothetical protein